MPPRPIGKCSICELNIIRSDAQIERFLETRSRICNIFYIGDNEIDGLLLDPPEPETREIVRYSDEQLRHYMESVVVLKCGHIFHKSCLRAYTLQSIRDRGELTCFVCGRRCHILHDETRVFLNPMVAIDIPPNFPLQFEAEIQVPQMAKIWEAVGTFWRLFTYPFKIFPYLYNNEDLAITIRRIWICMIYGLMVIVFFGLGTHSGHVKEMNEDNAEDEDLAGIEFDPFNIHTAIVIGCFGILMAHLDLDIPELLFGPE